MVNHLALRNEALFLRVIYWHPLLLPGPRCRHSKLRFLVPAFGLEEYSCVATALILLVPVIGLVIVEMQTQVDGVVSGVSMPTFVLLSKRENLLFVFNSEAQWLSRRL